jgi:2-hydroxycyclohexanecarboxyl-CoA dehydrogenase
MSREDSVVVCSKTRGEGRHHHRWRWWYRSAAGNIFCKEGAKVALIDRDADVPESAVVEIRRKLAGAHVEGFVADLGEESAAGIVVDKVITAFGKLDVLVKVGIR